MVFGTYLVILLAMLRCTVPTSTVTLPAYFETPTTISPIPPTPLATSSDTPEPVKILFPTPNLPKFNSPSPIPLKLCSPLGGYTFEELPVIESQPFSPNRPGKDDGHQGVDFAHWQYKGLSTLEDAPIQAVLAGVVAASISDKFPYGNMIIIETPFEQLSENLVSVFQIMPDQSLYLLYAHMKHETVLIVGDLINCGEVLGRVGNTGASGNPHLHFETRTGPAGIHFESMEYYKTTSTDEERASYERWRFAGEFKLFDPWVLLVLGG
jgi:murein DD-endopeptidase MepM/ murein hydrolase activator NlpD